MKKISFAPFHTALSATLPMFLFFYLPYALALVTPKPGYELTTKVIGWISAGSFALAVLAALAVVLYNVFQETSTEKDHGNNIPQ